MSAPSVLQVFVFRDEAYVGSEIFTEPEIVIGNSHLVALRIDDQTIGPEHAVLSHEEGRATVLDLGHPRGTFVNRAPVHQSFVTARDEIRIGEHTLKIKFMGSASRRASKGLPVSGANATYAPDTTPAPRKTPEFAAPGAPRRPPGRQDPAALAGSQSAFEAEAWSRPDLEPKTELYDVTPRPPLTASDLAPESWSQPPAALQAAHGHGRVADYEALWQPGLQDVAASTDQEATYGADPGRDGAARPRSHGAIPADFYRAHPAERGDDSPGKLGPVAPRDFPFADVGASRRGPILEGPDAIEAALESAFEPTGAPTEWARTGRPSRSSDALPNPDPRSSRQPGVGRADGGIRPEATATATPTPGRGAAMPRRREDGDEGRAARDPRSVGSPGIRASAKTPPQPSRHTPSARVGAVGQGPEGDEDPDDLEQEIRPPFSLLDELIRQPRSAGRGPALSLEVIAFSDEGVQNASLLTRRGDRFITGEGRGQHRDPGRGQGANAPGRSSPIRLASLLEPGRALLQFPASARGTIERDHQRTNLDALKVPANAVSKAGGLYQVVLDATMAATLDVEGHGFHLRFVQPPRPPAESAGGKKVVLDPFTRNSLLAALGLHLVVFIIIGMFSAGVSYSETSREEWAALVQDVRDVEIEPEPPPEPEVPPPEPEVEPEPDPEPIAPPEPTPPRPTREREPPTKRRAARTAPAKGYTAEEVKGAGVLGAMGKLNLKAPGQASIMQKVSNIDAVRAPGGSNFRVGALVGKMPSSEVSLGAGGGGGPLTRGSAALIKGGQGFAQIGKRTGSTQVRGTVTRASATRLQAQGSISREEVARVINQHLREVQACYERTLISDPGLSGKLVLEWTIKQDGSVGRVKQKTSTLRNPAVASCIMGSLQRWRFPRPTGGVVIVSYPFIFSSVGF